MSILRFALTSRLFKGRVFPRIQRVEKFSSTTGNGKPPGDGNDGNKSSDGKGKDENLATNDSSKSKLFFIFQT